MHRQDIGAVHGHDEPLGGVVGASIHGLLEDVDTVGIQRPDPLRITRVNRGVVADSDVHPLLVSLRLLVHALHQGGEHGHHGDAPGEEVVLALTPGPTGGRRVGVLPQIFVVLHGGDGLGAVVDQVPLLVEPVGATSLHEAPHLLLGEQALGRAERRTVDVDFAVTVRVHGELLGVLQRLRPGVRRRGGAHVLFQVAGAIHPAERKRPDGDAPVLVPVLEHGQDVVVEGQARSLGRLDDIGNRRESALAVHAHGQVGDGEVHLRGGVGSHRGDVLRPGVLPHHHFLHHDDVGVLLVECIDGDLDGRHPVGRRLVMPHGDLHHFSGLLHGRLLHGRLLRGLLSGLLSGLLHGRHRSGGRCLPATRGQHRHQQSDDHQHR